MAVTEKQTLGFQAEVKQLLQLMIHSLYSNKEIFLRELISNASDAADKLRFEAINNDALFENDPDLKIRVDFDKDARTITIADNGIGMSRDEVVAHLGTIAKSGTREFFAKLSGDQQKDAALIGQFGVGFYSAFIVADRITVETRRAGLPASEGVRWESDGEGDYTVEAIDKADARHRRHPAPARRRGRAAVVVEAAVDHPQVLRPHLAADPDEEGRMGRGEEGDGRQATNWRPSTRPARCGPATSAEITPEQYDEFYKHVAHDFEAPLTYTHNRVEGRSEYTQLLYIPAHAPFDLWDRDKRGGIKLYVQARLHHGRRRAADAGLPALRQGRDRFERPAAQRLARDPAGVARRRGDPRRLDQARAGHAGRTGQGDEQDQKDKYATFWKEFGQVLKEGIGEDSANKERIAKLLRFASTHNDNDEQTVSLRRLRRRA